MKRQLKLPLCGRCLASLSLDRLDGGINAERLQDSQHLCADGSVDAQAADRDAARRAVVRAGAIAAVAAELAAVGHMQLAAGMTSAQKSGQQQLSAPYRSLDRGAAFAGCVVGDHASIPLELVLGYVGPVMILDQNIPFGHRPMHATARSTSAASLGVPPTRAGRCMEAVHRWSRSAVTASESIGLTRISKSVMAITVHNHNECYEKLGG